MQIPRLDPLTAMVLGQHAIALDLAAMKLAKNGNQSSQDVLRDLMQESLARLDGMTERELDAVLENIITQLDRAAARHSASLNNPPNRPGSGWAVFRQPRHDKN